MTVARRCAWLLGGVAVLLAACAESGVGDAGRTGDDREPQGRAADGAAGEQPSATTDDASSCPTAADASGGAGSRSQRRLAGAEGVAFDDVTADVGLVDPLVGMYGHAAAQADVDRDGWTDLFVGGFADRDVEEYRRRGADGPSADRLLMGGPHGFEVDDRFPGDLARTSGATFADLDGDGDLDLVVVRNPRDGDEISERPTTVYENQGGLWMVATTLLPRTGGRSVAALDVDRDSLLDLAIAADRFGDGPTRLLRNTGELTFADASDDWGVPDDMFGLALAAADLDDDGWLDLVLSGDERVLRGGPDGFSVAIEPVLAWKPVGDEDDAAGIAVGDLDGDHRPDLAVGQHFNSTLDAGKRVPVRVFVNRSGRGEISFDDVTAEAGSPGLGTKAPHVAIADLDNDGLADLLTSATAADGRPLVLRNTGRRDGVPRFDVIGEPGDGAYWVTGATGDFDRDGRVDVFVVAWEPARASSLFRNVGTSGRWVELDLTDLGPAATGARVEAHTGDVVLARGWVASTTGYAAGESAVVHLGLGAAVGDEIDLTVMPVGGTPRAVRVVVDARSAVGAC